MTFWTSRGAFDRICDRIVPLSCRRMFLRTYRSVFQSGRRLEPSQLVPKKRSSSTCSKKWILWAKSPHILRGAGAATLVATGFGLYAIEQNVYKTDVSADVVAIHEGDDTTQNPMISLEPKFINEQYTIGSVIGQGSFGVVRHCRDLIENQECVVKVIDYNSPGGEETALREAAILKSVGQHPSICTFRNAISKDGCMYLIFQYLEGKTLCEELKLNGPISEKKAAKLVRHLLKAVSHLHGQNIVHRDIKPENLIYQDNRSPTETKSDIVLIDFGMAVKLEGKAYSTRRSIEPQDGDGTFAYWSPEMMKRESYGPPSDVWAIGVTAYSMLVGVHPFDPRGNRPEMELYRGVVSGHYWKGHNMWKKISRSGQKFIKLLLDTDPNCRVTCEEAMKHEWFLEQEAAEQ